MTRKQKDAKRKRLVKAFTLASFGSAKYFRILRDLETLERQPVTK